ncbi:glucose-1-phosphate adenylyltransferase subunit GlgD [Oceanobacillus saliphilus]|uniref:glucose-1-phosphate adenylyltransferase subunit GlgD n=1 Tax=Oceanobacillus saliphilus TaxID=2925834 RepID=UPI00201D6CFF|nr:glucose-1-phosphate adenylyltransferase subunit GlgD [Oceanobacillus saliphilus]
MTSLMGLINLDHEHSVFNELSYFRSSASLPFGGRYRMIDFALSNMVNSNISEVAIFVRNKYRSLLDHIGTGENWELDRRNGGLFILPPDWNDPTDRSQGDLRFFHNNRDYFHRSKSKYVLISGSQFISNTDYKNAFAFHLDRKADVTLITTDVGEVQPEHYPYFRIEADGSDWVTNITNDQKNSELFTGVYIINKDLLMNLVDTCIAYNKDHFFECGIKDKLSEINVQKYKHEGYSAFVNTIESFYKQNMNLLKEENYRDLFFNNNFVRTKISNNPPVKYFEQAVVNHSLLANGCVIDGTVEGSMLFRGVNVKKGATIKNSIIMQRCTIEEGVYLENVILDKDVHVTRNQKIIGSKEKPYVVAKRQVI